MKKFADRKISYRLLALTAVIVLIFAIVPLLYIAKYDVPVDDDLGYSAQTHAAVVNGDSFFKVITCAITKTAETYKSWQGSFSAVFLMTLQPGIFGYDYYQITAYLMLFSLIGSIFYFCRTFFTGLFGADRHLSYFIAAVVSFICIELVPWPNQSFFWYNGSVYYTFFFCLMLVLCGISIKFLKDEKKWLFIIICVLSFFIGGGNYVTALSCAILGFSAVALLALSGNKKWRFFALALLLLLLSFSLSALAPGNSVRQAESPDHPGVFEAIRLSLWWGGYFVKLWCSSQYWGMLLLLSPVLWEISKTEEVTLRFPLAVSCFSFLFLCAMCTPHIYALGSPGPERIQNIIYFAFIILSIINLFWWFSWINKKRVPRPETYLSPVAFIPTALLAGACFIFPIITGTAKMTSAIALGELRSGEAAIYYNEQLQRLDILEDPEITDACLEPLSVSPFLLFSGEYTDDPEYYTNRDAATYFGKNSIILKSAPAD